MTTKQSKTSQSLRDSIRKTRETADTPAAVAAPVAAETSAKAPARRAAPRQASKAGKTSEAKAPPAMYSVGRRIWPD